MSIPDSTKNRLRQALNFLKELKVSEDLQETALRYLLDNSIDVETPIEGKRQENVTTEIDAQMVGVGIADFKAFIEEKQPATKAVEEIPCFVYWQTKRAGKEVASEDDIKMLYKRAGRVPPRRIAQAFRDLSTKRYNRLKAAKGRPGCVQMAEDGEFFVENELPHR